MSLGHTSIYQSCPLQHINLGVIYRIFNRYLFSTVPVCRKKNRNSKFDIYKSISCQGLNCHECNKWGERFSFNNRKKYLPQRQVEILKKHLSPLLSSLVLVINVTRLEAAHTIFQFMQGEHFPRVITVELILSKGRTQVLINC